MFSKKGGMQAEREVTTYRDEVRTVYADKTSHQEVVRIPETHREVVKQKCTKCGSSFCPKSCCGILSKEVVARATAQGGSGEPLIGLIPTMKPLVPEKQ